MLQNQYNPTEVENKWQKIWQQMDVYKWDANESREQNFVIDTPPPTVSGLLHMGHIFSYTQTDFIARFQRMYGKNVFYPMGFDDNGLPTERLVEKIKDVRAIQMPREEFKNLCKEVVVEAEEEFKALFESIALSVDWKEVYQTINPEITKLSQMSFIDLFRKGHIERRNSPCFWDSVDQTAIAQAEIEDKEKQGIMNEIIFKSDEGQDLIIATTRPELLCACAALLFNPNDKRYQKLEGKFAIVPLYGFKVKIIADADVDIEKGTGLVMCCTFGDIQDITWWRKYNLELKNCISLKGKMQNAGKYDDLYIKDARVKIIEELKENSLLVKQTQITQNVKCAERSGMVLEIIPTPQWYIKLLDKKDELIEKARACKWHPDYMRIRLENWVNGLNQDWCISRQRYFGVPFPIWYSKRKGEEGKILVANIDQLPIDPSTHLPKGYTRGEIEPDMDVMDTWATSSISPQLNSKAISKEFSIDFERHKKLYPADLRPQAHEIIRTWAFYTIAKSLLHENNIPWKNLMISGWCLASDKTKMSKSKGNVITPKELIVEKGADIVRYWASTSKLGVDIIYSEEVFKIGKKLINKLWNASKFLEIHLNQIEGVPSTVSSDIRENIITESLDLWILSKFHQTIENATNALLSFEYCDARVAVEDFFWNSFCDNYLEIVKVRIYNEDSKNFELKQSAIYTLFHILSNLYKLFAPFIPHICEELNSTIFSFEPISKRGTWPKLENFIFNNESIQTGKDVLAILEVVRKYKSINNLSLKTEIETICYTGYQLNSSAENDLKNACNAKNISYYPTHHDFKEIYLSENHKIDIRMSKPHSV